jgi:hypothetical protein
MIVTTDELENIESKRSMQLKLIWK